jgi:hypothetical protein
MNGPVRLVDFLKSDTARDARLFNDRLRDALSTNSCPYCGFVLEHSQQQHVCRRELAGSR